MSDEFFLLLRREAPPVGTGRAPGHLREIKSSLEDLSELLTAITFFGFSFEPGILEDQNHPVASTGAGAALVAAAERSDVVGAIVSRGGRPDLAGPALVFAAEAMDNDSEAGKSARASMASASALSRRT